MTYQIDSRVLAEQPTAVVRASLSVDGIGAWLPVVYQEVAAYLDDTGVAPTGPPFARYTFRDHTAEVEAGFPVTKPVPASGRITLSTLPGGPAAVTTHHGPYDRLPDAYDAVAVWLKEHGHKADEPHWEIYYTDPFAEPDPARPAGAPTSWSRTGPADRRRRDRRSRVAPVSSGRQAATST